MGLGGGRRLKLCLRDSPVIGGDFFGDHLVRSTHGAESRELIFGRICQINNGSAGTICRYAVVDHVQKLVEKGRVDNDHLPKVNG